MICAKFIIFSEKLNVKFIKMLLSHFDYHLLPEEKSQVEQLVPANQAKIHFAFKANITYNQSEYENSIVALSEHNVTFCSHSFFGKGYRLLTNFHFFDIDTLNTVSDDKIEISTSSECKFIILSPASTRFARLLLRNFVIANPMLPPGLRFEFTIHDKRYFPPFEPFLSPSQMFQFTYNSYCSYYNLSYFHDVSMYFHRLIKTGTGLFNFNELPLHLTEFSFNNNINIDNKISDVRPITSALSHCRFIHGINCEGISMRDILIGVSTVVLFNPNLRLLRLVDCGAENGCLELSNAMLQSKNKNIEYWDLSGNKMTDFARFAAAFGKYKCESIRSIKLKNCQLQHNDLTILFNSIIENDGCQDLEQVVLSGNILNHESCEDFVQVLNTLPQTKLDLLELGPVDNPMNIIEGLVGYQLTQLRIIDSKFSHDSSEALANFVKLSHHIEELDLSGSSFQNNDLPMIINEFIQNQNVINARLKLSRIKMNQKDMNSLFQLFLDYRNKITELSLDEDYLPYDPTLNSTSHLSNHHNPNMDSNDIDLNSSLGVLDVFRVFESLPNIKKLSLARNFTKKQEGVGRRLAKLVLLPTLKSLNLAGDSKWWSLQQEAFPIISALSSSLTLHEFDISGNQIGDNGIKMLTRAIIMNNSLRVLVSDRSDPIDINTLIEFLNILTQSHSLISCSFMLDDCYNILTKLVGENQDRTYDLIEHMRNLLIENEIKNRAEIGIFNDLSLLNDSVLDDILDDITIDVQCDLQKTDSNIHNSIHEIVGLPLPYQYRQSHRRESLDNSNLRSNMNSNLNLTEKPNEFIAFDFENESNENSGVTYSYVIDIMNEQLTEPQSPLSPVSGKSIQFNSLIKRKPDSLQILEEREKSNKYKDTSTFNLDESYSVSENNDDCDNDDKDNNP
ncbi:hypothetical protein TRFO_14831 [Tritrichomonas foetus]|uniref:Leucine Rich Repeat family protein n=1 Tax=Tritrichomonas foetus TaxID=1144522 RepID=A0A1J4KTN8_9EUKA|nr:hypothetical protein TRFO_14831 [Tritrichomonas foetus]|eukprot:OHT14665.1 hypothetical protein TRFO_14831 [Tritrichomonas foetus]